MIFSYIMQNPNLRLLLLSNPSVLNEVIVGQGFRTIVRQLLQQSPALLNSIRTGTSANIVIGQQPGSNPQAQVGSIGTNQLSADTGMSTDFNVDYYGDGEDDGEDGDDDEDHSGHDHSHEGHDHAHDHGHGTGAGSSLSTEDQQNIAQLMEITGSQFPMAKQAYESSGKSMEIAGSLLMQLMFN